MLKNIEVRLKALEARLKPAADIWGPVWDSLKQMKRTISPVTQPDGSIKMGHELTDEEWDAHFEGAFMTKEAFIEDRKNKMLFGGMPNANSHPEEIRQGERGEDIASR